MFTGGRVDSGNPKPAELAFAGLTVPESVVPGSFAGFPDGAVLAAFRTKVTLGEFKKLFFSFM